MRVRVDYGPDCHETFSTNLMEIAKVIQETAEIIADLLGCEAFITADGVRLARLFTVRRDQKVNVTTYTPDGSHAISGYWAPSA